MSAIESLLAGLFDYAGLYPPASLSIRSAANNYLEYRNGEHAWALGRFIVNLDRIEELRSVVGQSFGQMKLSVIASETTDWDNLTDLIHSGAPIDSIEIKCGNAVDIERFASQIPCELTTYFEIGMDAARREALDAIAATGTRAKIRMGGVIADAFPSIADVAQMLENLAAIRLPFKATAGLHHPVRSRRPLTYQPQSPQGTMHGFVNLSCAAALIYAGANHEHARAMLEEQDPSMWRVSSNTIQWRDRSWTADQIAEIRNRFLISIGSCSFEEPIHDLQTLGWL